MADEHGPILEKCDIAPCPFCGSPQGKVVDLDLKHAGRYGAVFRSACGSTGPIAVGTAHQAVRAMALEKWNLRWQLMLPKLDPKVVKPAVGIRVLIPGGVASWDGELWRDELAGGHPAAPDFEPRWWIAFPSVDD